MFSKNLLFCIVLVDLNRKSALKLSESSQNIVGDIGRKTTKVRNKQKNYYCLLMLTVFYTVPKFLFTLNIFT